MFMIIVLVLAVILGFYLYSCKTSSYFDMSKYPILYIGNNSNYMNFLEMHLYQYSLPYSKDSIVYNTYENTDLKIELTNDVVTINDLLVNDCRVKEIDYKGKIIKILNETDNPVLLTKRKYLTLVLQEETGGEWKDVQFIDYYYGMNEKNVILPPNEFVITAVPVKILEGKNRLKFGKSYSNEIY